MGRSISSVREEFRTHLTDGAWQILEDDAVNQVLRVAPPVTETIGNDNGYQVLEIDFDSTSIGFTGRLFTHKSNNKVYHVKPQFATSSRTYAVTVNGYEYTTGGNVNGSDSDTRVLEMYNSLVAAKAEPANAATLGFVDLELVQFNPGDHYIKVTQNDTSQDITVTGVSYMYANQASQWVAPDSYLDIGVSRRRSVSCDYATGFIYYLSIHERSLILATKTTTDFYGPISGSWADNQAIASQSNPELHLQELYVSSIPDSIYGTVKLSTTHLQGYIANSQVTSIEDSTYTAFNYNSTSDSSSEMGVDILTLRTPYAHQPLRQYDFRRGDRTEFSDLDGNAFPVYNSLGVTGYVLSLNNFDISNTKVLGQSVSFGNNSGYTRRFSLANYPSFQLDDVYVFLSTATNESLHLIRFVTISDSLASSITDSDVSMPLNDAASFPDEGTVILGGEVVSYSGKSGNTLTGLSRGRYGTTASSHDSATEVFAARWFVKINNGALLAGFTRPE